MSGVDASRWRAARDIFDDVVERPAAEREAALAAACGGDAALRTAVERLLTADDAATAGSAFLDPVARGYDALLAEPAPDADIHDPLLGRTLGPYRIIARLGEGGMGIVYEAEQPQPRRRVALKILRRSHAFGERGVRTFQREAQALARLKHPGIAAIYDAGRSDDDLHYFAMELVRGTPLDAYLRESATPGAPDRATVAQRLALFLDVCDAIGYAHQRGVLHRDLKPSNIVLLHAEETGTRTPREGAPGGVKVLDFGLARITDDDVSMASAQTDMRVIQGTLPYMSPEQARGNPDEIDTRSDIYALGVLLYQLLTGQLPYDTHRTLLAESLRIICEEPPARPSAIHRTLRGDLETIVLKALEKDPEQRYASVAEFADDIRRYREGLPITARRPTAWYQARKFAARHRTATVLSGALVVALLGGIAFTSAALVRARRAEHAASAAAEKARQEAASAGRIASFLETVFKVSNPSVSQGNTVTARQLLDSSVVKIDRDLGKDPRVQARLYTAMGNSYVGLGLYAQARPLLEKAMALQHALQPPDSLAQSECAFRLASLMRRQGEVTQSIALYRESLALRERIYGTNAPELSGTIGGLANAYFELGDFVHARPYFERSLALAQNIRPVDPINLAARYSGISLLFLQLGDYPRALAYIDKGIAMEEKVVPPSDLDLLQDLSVRAQLLNRTGRFPEALATLRRVLAQQEATLGPTHASLAATLHILGETYQGMQRDADAKPVLERSVRIWRASLGPNHPSTALTEDVLAVSLSRLGDVERARALSTHALSVLRASLDSTDIDIALALLNRGRIELARGDLTAADARLREGERIALFSNADTSVVLTEFWIQRALVADARGAYGQADSLFDRAGRVLTRSASSSPLLREGFYTDRAKALERRGDLAAAARWRAKAAAEKR